VLYATIVSRHVGWTKVRLLHASSRVFLYIIILLIYPISLNYTWINQDRKSVNLAAPTYIDYVMTWVQNLLDDENVFPTKSGKPPDAVNLLQLT
jgi:hypothetical protein